jgi:FkbM family methyltransferase
MRVRPAVPADLPACAELLEAGQREIHAGTAGGWLASYFAQAVEGEEVFIAVTAENTLAGFVTLWRPEGFVHFLHVSAAFRRRGIGRKLLAHVRASVDGPLELKCAPHNAAALAFYARLGWTETERDLAGASPYVRMRHDALPNTSPSAKPDPGRPQVSSWPARTVEPGFQATCPRGFAMLEDRFDEMRRKYAGRAKSQFGHDALVLAVLGEKADGYFVEVGAGDGVNLSNTHLLETELGWRGLLIEPNPLFHASVRRNRKAALDTRAAYSSCGESVAFVDYEELSTLLPFKSGDGHDREGRPVIRVETATLDGIFAAHGVPGEIDYLSLDTEGSELEVLQGLDLGRYRPRVMTVEHNSVPGRRRGIIEHLGRRGYRPVLEDRSGVDAWLVRDAGGA